MISSSGRAQISDRSNCVVYSTFIGESAMFFSPHHRWNFNSKTHTATEETQLGSFQLRIDSAQRLCNHFFFFDYFSRMLYSTLKEEKEEDKKRTSLERRMFHRNNVKRVCVCVCVSFRMILSATYMEIRRDEIMIK